MGWYCLECERTVGDAQCPACGGVALPDDDPGVRVFRATQKRRAEDRRARMSTMITVIVGTPLLLGVVVMLIATHESPKGLPEVTFSAAPGGGPSDCTQSCEEDFRPTVLTDPMTDGAPRCKEGEPCSCPSGLVCRGFSQAGIGLGTRHLCVRPETRSCTQVTRR